MPPTSPLARQLAARLERRPAALESVARAVADEDVSALARLLRAFDLDDAVESIEQLLDSPGPFLPSAAGWT